MSAPDRLPRPSVSVIVPARDAGPDLVRCLDAICACDPAPDEIIVVVDGGDSGAGALAARPRVRVLTLPEQGGPARARNHGVRDARGDIVVFFDADVSPHADAVGRLADAFARDPALAAVMGSYDSSPAAPGFLSQYKNLLHHFVHQTSRRDASTFWGACGAVRRDVFVAAGGFDERYRRPAIEDIEFGYRLVRAGHRLRLVPEIQVTHLKRWRPWTLLRSDLFDRALPWTLLIWRDRRFVDDLNLRQSARASVALSWVGLAALVAAPLQPALLVPAAISMSGLLWLNADFYAFLRRERGVAFALRALPWHWLTYAGSGLAFAAGTAWWWVSARRTAT